MHPRCDAPVETAGIACATDIADSAADVDNSAQAFAIGLRFGVDPTGGGPSGGPS
jgi:hypothetical protein